MAAPNRLVTPVRRAFTILELIITIALIATLISLILPALLSARASAREVGSIATITSLCSGLRENQQPGTYCANGLFHSSFPLGSEDHQAWLDPFRITPMAQDPILAPLGTLRNIDYPPNGFGHFIVSFENRGSRPFSTPQDPFFAGLRLPADVQYFIVGVGRNGHLDWNPANDIVLVKTPMYVSVVRHR